MSHYGTDTELKTKTPAEWLAAGAQVGELVNKWAKRTDLVVYIGEKAGKGVAPALFSPESAEIEVNSVAAFGHVKPKKIGDLRKRKTLFEFPKAAGAIFHEASHARFGTWNMRTAMKQLSGEEYRALHLLEEGRIERLGARHNPENRAFLRACALEIVLADLSEETFAKMTSTRQAAHLAALTLGRVTAGVLEESDVLSVQAKLDEMISTDLIDALTEIWTEFQSISDAETQIGRMYDLARTWNRIVQDAAEANGEGSEDEQGEPGEGGSGMGGLGDLLGEILDALAEDAEATGIEATNDVNDQQTTEEWQEKAEQQAKDAAAKDGLKKTAEKVFGQGTGPLKAHTSSRLRETRQPNSAERIAAVTVAKMLEKAKYRDRVRVQSASVLPPGRLRTRAMVQGAALKSRGITTQVEPWRRVQHKHTEDPNLTIGVMVDISGSMSAAMNPMASAAWILSEAVRRVQGRAAMVYYGNDVFPTLKPGEHLSEVKVYTADDGTESFDKGLSALDGALDLTTGSGARMVVIVSDGCYTAEEKAACKRWLKRCQQTGVAVLWLGFGRSESYAGAMCKETDAVYVPVGSDVAAAAMAIGTAAERALSTAGARNAY